MPWRAASGGILVRLRLTPKSSSDRIEGIMPTSEGPALKARVRAVPEDGKANAAAARLLAEWAGVAPGTVQLVSGATSRVKTFLIAGDAAGLSSRLDDRAGRS